MANRKPRQRGNAEGSVYSETRRRAGGEVTRWFAQVTVRGTKRRTVHNTEAQAKRALRKMLTEAESGNVDHGTMTVKQLLNEWSTKALPNRGLAPATIARHRFSINALTRTRTDDGDVKPSPIARRRVRDLTPEDIERYFADLTAKGAAKATLMKHRSTLGMALAWAERRGYVSRNVARVVELPTDARPAEPGRTMTADEAQRFVKATEGARWPAMWVAMLYLGLRPGEAAGLSWEDVDLDAGVLHVRKAVKRGERGEVFLGAPKTAHSVRSLDMPAAVVEELRRQRARQNAQRLAAGPPWSNPDDLVFTSGLGGAVDPKMGRRDFGGVVLRAKLEGSLSPVDLRHTAASLMSDAGVPLEVVADQLGHRDTRMASLHYRHRVRPTVNGASALVRALG